MTRTESYEKIAINLGELHKKLQRMQSQMLKEYDISLAEFHVIMMLNSKKSVSQNELADALNVDKALISRQIQSMQNKGLIVCDSDPNCRRRNILTLSDASKAIIPKLKKVHKCSLEMLFSDVEQEKLKELQILLGGLVNKI